MKLFGAVGPDSHDFLSMSGAAIVDSDRSAMEFVFKYCRVIEFTDFGRPTMLLPDFVRARGQSYPINPREWE